MKTHEETWAAAFLATLQKSVTRVNLFFHKSTADRLRWAPSERILSFMKTTTATTTETAKIVKGKTVQAWLHVCVLSCGHTEERTDSGFGGAWSAPKSLKCAVCGK